MTVQIALAGTVSRPLRVVVVPPNSIPSTLIPLTTQIVIGGIAVEVEATVEVGARVGVEAAWTRAGVGAAAGLVNVGVEMTVMKAVEAAGRV